MPFSRPFSFGQMKINMGTLLTPSLTLSSKRVPLLCCIALRRTQTWRVFRTVAMGNPSCLKLSRFALPDHEDTPVTWDACFFPVQYCSPAGCWTRCEGLRSLRSRSQVAVPDKLSEARVHVLDAQRSTPGVPRTVLFIPWCQ